MTYKVLIVDDEPMIRFGLGSFVDWAAEGFELIGDASNGEAALERIGNEPIDLLITDIKMPLMDGLELARRTKSLLPGVKVILVSSFNEFEYAREAVRLGVVLDYLLKPTMEPEDLLRILRQSKAVFDADAERNREAVRLAEEADRANRDSLERAFRSALAGDGELPEAALPWAGGPLRLSVWREALEGPLEGPQEGRQGWLQEAGADRERERSRRSGLSRLEQAKERLNRELAEGLAVLTGEAEVVVLIADRRGASQPELVRLHRLLLEEGWKMTVGSSPVVFGLSKLREAYRWAAHAADRGFYDGSGHCYEGVLPLPAHLERERAERANSLLRDSREQFVQSLSSFEVARSSSLLDRTAAAWRTVQLPKGAVVDQAREMLATLWSLRHERSSEERMRRRIGVLARLENADSLASLVCLLREELSGPAAPDGLRLAAEESGAQAIQSALGYIRERYRDDLTLQAVADFIHMSKNYFSEQFKRHTGHNFIEYVIRLRIDHAKHLLETTHLKIIDVGAKSGFQSPKHFLKLFKRLEGMTPAEYRMGSRAGGSPGAASTAPSGAPSAAPSAAPSVATSIAIPAAASNAPSAQGGV
ncbi:response regulator transcription factor [Cohnella fermenti]|uniref:Response regulator n=1 Tax=Cohnella fermenti TaxID=2565925 RepID=A0A4S4BI26_9BACL|nr:helix-turn-helix domain-containing protein [Cohnella fermenti]THF74005.1 response regulator [Cohnella fermenti]